MSRQRLTSPAIVLRRYPMGEADRLLVLFTPENGLVRAVAKGLRRSRKRFAGILDLLYLVETDLQRRKGSLLLLEEARLVDGFRPLSRDILLLAAGCYLSEIASAFSSENHSDSQAFAALAGGLTALCRGGDPAAIGRAVEMHTLVAAGLSPELDHCVLTGRALRDDETVAFEARHGGAVCLGKAEATTPRLTPAVRHLLSRTMAADLPSALALEWDRVSSVAAREALLDMFAFHGGRALKSRRFAGRALRYLRENRSKIRSQVGKTEEKE